MTRFRFKLASARMLQVGACIISLLPVVAFGTENKVPPTAVKQVPSQSTQQQTVPAGNDDGLPAQEQAVPWPTTIMLPYDSVTLQAEPLDIDKYRMDAASDSEGSFTELIESAPSSSLRAWAALGLGALRFPRSSTDLIRTLDSDDDPKVRQVAISALAQIGDDDDETVAALIRHLSDADPVVQAWSAMALGLLRNHKAVAPLLHLLSITQSSKVRQTIIVSFGLIGDPKATDAIISNIKHNDNATNRLVAWSLGQLRDPQAIPPLIDLLNSGDPDVRLMTIKSLEKQRAALAVEPLMTRLRSRGDKNFRSLCAEALGEIGDRRAVPLLIEVLKEGGFVARSAALALGKLGDHRAFVPLLAALQNHDVDYRDYAARALGMLKDPRAFAPLVAAYREKPGKNDEDDSNRYLHISVVEALGSLGDSRAIPYIVNALHSDDNWERQAAIIAANNFHSPQIVDALIVDLNDEDQANSGLAIEALGGSHDTRAIGPLVKMLSTVPSLDIYTSTRNEITLSLAALTGKNLGDRADVWISWWNEQHK